MSTEENKSIARRLREGFDKSKGAVGFEEYVAPDVVFHFPGSPPLNREQISGMNAMFYAAFPNLHHVFEDQIAEGDKVVTRVTLRGTHQGEFQGIPATGKEIVIGAIFVDRFRDGKLIEHWSQPDMMGMMQQLGAIPSSGRSES